MKKQSIITLLFALPLLCSAASENKNYLGYRFLSAVKDLYLATASKLLDDNTNIDYSNVFINKALPYAVKHKWFSIAQHLLSHGVNPDSQDENGQTALMVAASGLYDYTDLILLLIKNRADVNFQTSDGSTALILSITFNNIDITKLLLAHGADPNKADKYGRTPLMHAICEDHIQIDTTRLLLDHGANPNLQAENGNSALYLAAGTEKYQTARLLLERGADVNLKSKYGDTALSYALTHSSGNNYMIEVLLTENTDVTYQDKNGNTLLILAIFCGHIKITTRLLTLAADVNFKDKYGNTALHYAAKRGHTEIVRILLKCRK